MFNFKALKHGQLHGEFRDRFGATCSIQESSFIDEECIWLGVDVDMQGQDLPTARMHLTRAMAKELMGVLRFFVRTGALGKDDFAGRLQVGVCVRGVSLETLGVEGRVVMRSHESVRIQERMMPDRTWTVMLDQVEHDWEITDGPPPLTSQFDHLLEDGVDPPADDGDDRAPAGTP